jgi:hypothetical protein
VDEIIERLLDVRNGRPGKQVQLAENEIRLLCLTAKEIFMSQPNLLELEAPIKICGTLSAPCSSGCGEQLLTRAGCAAGDIHGQYSDLLRLFEYGGFPPEANYLFLGDYVDRGKQSLETICLLLAFKVGLAGQQQGVGLMQQACPLDVGAEDLQMTGQLIGGAAALWGSSGTWQRLHAACMLQQLPGA